MLEVSRSDFIRSARAKGLRERRVVWVHGFRNAVTPVMTLAGIDLGALIGGAIIIEIATFFFVFANLLVDLGHAWVDPRVRLGRQARRSFCGSRAWSGRRGTLCDANCRDSSGGTVSPLGDTVPLKQARPSDERPGVYVLAHAAAHISSSGCCAQ